jgi:hypothetical protein
MIALLSLPTRPMSRRFCNSLVLRSHLTDEKGKELSFSMIRFIHDATSAVNSNSLGKSSSLIVTSGMGAISSITVWVKFFRLNFLQYQTVMHRNFCRTPLPTVYVLAHSDKRRLLGKTESITSSPMSSAAGDATERSSSQVHRPVGRAENSGRRIPPKVLAQHTARPKAMRRVPLRLTCLTKLHRKNPTAAANLLPHPAPTRWRRPDGRCPRTVPRPP